MQPPDADGPDPHNDDEIIYSYTREQALEDGVLIDLTPWAKKLGFSIPIACTAAVWHRYIVPPKETRALGQSERGRAHDLLWMLACAIRGNEIAASVLHFETVFVQRANVRRTITFKTICGPSDLPPADSESGETQPLAVITILLPHED